MLRMFTVVIYMFVALSQSSVHGDLTKDRMACDASCLNRTILTWPPPGFVQSELMARCSLRCKLENKKQCLEDCLAHLNTTCPNISTLCQTETTEFEDTETRNDSNLLPAPNIEEHTIDYNFKVSIPGFNPENTSLFYYMILKNPLTNQSAFREINTSHFTIDLSGLICSDLIIYYVVDSDLSRSPQVSLPRHIKVKAAVPSNLKIEFEEDFSRIRHAVLNVSWTPVDPAGLCYYKITLQPFQNTTDSTCNNQSAFSVILNNSQSSLTIDASSNSNGSAPLYDCMYSVVVQTFPGGESASQNVDIKYDGPQSKLILECYSIYNEDTQDYNIFGNWSVSDQRALAVIPSYSVNLKRALNEGNLFTESIPGITPTATNTSSVVFENQMILKGTGFYQLVVWAFLPLPTSPYHYRISLHPGIDENTCKTFAPLINPDPVTMLVIEEPSLKGNVLKFTVRWMLPDFFNGGLQRTEILVIGHGVNESTNETLTSRTLLPTKTSFKESIDLAAHDLKFDTISVQMRVKDTENLYSDWSSPAFLTLSDVQVINVSIVTSSSGSTQLVTETQQLSLPTYAIALIAVAVVLAILIGIIVLLIVLHISLQRHRKSKLLKKSDRDVVILPRTGSFKKWPEILRPLQYTFSLDAWEVAPEDITIFEDSVLGKGNFGEVHKGQLSGRGQKRGSVRGMRAPRFSLNCIVAIKRLQSNVDQFEKSNFLKEIEMMKKVSGGDNDLSNFIVNMVGCVTTKEPMLLVLEYVKYGNLLSYLRYVRVKKFSEASYRPAPYLEPIGTYSKLAPSTSKYDGLGDVQEKDILEFARQIAAGMEYLSGLGIIHRDLACRNILLGESKNLKISDFGLSRHLNSDDVYVPTSHGVLPIRWMAIESLFHREFTSASDVWSYGVVLWEMATLGTMPYFKYSNEEVTRLLRQGYRMKKPESCSVDVYDTMLYCWSQTPEERPKFGDLRKEFDRFLSAHIQDKYPYIEIESMKPYQFDKLAPETGQRRESTSSDEMKTVNLSEGDEDDLLALQIQKSPTPQKPKGKMSFLSSSTLCFDDELEKIDISVSLRDENADPAQQSFDTLSPSASSITNISDMNLLPADSLHEYDTLSPITNKFTSDMDPNVTKTSCSNNEESEKEESIEKSSNSRSSFRDELLYHFERRLSDLGPRSKYPYLQKLERSVTSGAYDAFEKKEKTDSGEKRSRRIYNIPKRKRVIKERSRRLAREAGDDFLMNRVKNIDESVHGCHRHDTEQMWHRHNESDRRHISSSDFPEETNHQLKHSHDSQYNTLHPIIYNQVEGNTYDTLQPYAYDSLGTS